MTDDAKLSEEGHLGHLLGHIGQWPYGIYFMNPPEKPDFPLVTYNAISASGWMPRIEGFNFTVWGGDCEAIHELIYGLLHEKPLGDTTGVKNVALLWNWAGPEIFDQNFSVYCRTHRYLQFGVKV